MKFGSVPLSEAEGAYLAHAVQAGSVKLKKGTRLGAEELATISAAGLGEVIVARLDANDVGEDEAATQLASLFAHPCLRLAQASTGRVNIYSEVDGLFVVNKAAIDAFNAIDPSVTIATLGAYAMVTKGQMVATVKIIPFAVPQSDLSAAAKAVPDGGAFQVAAWQPSKVGLIATRLPSLKPEIMDKTARILSARLARSGSVLTREMRVAHDENAVASAIGSPQFSDVDIIVVFGASAVVDPQDVIPEGIRLSGGEVLRVGMPVDPGNLLVLGERHGKPVIGAPGCARSPKENGFDWILDRLLAGVEVRANDFATMGVGGLLMEIETRPRPRDVAPMLRQVHLDGLLMAAGRSSRMGAMHKLSAHFNGEALIKRSAKVLQASGVRSVNVVLGHEAERMQGLLDGLEVSSIINPDFADGLASSLRSGIAALAHDSDGVLVHLADMPGVTSQMMRSMTQAFVKAGGNAIVRATHGGKRGNPVILPRSVYAQVSRLTGDMGARAIVEGFAGRIIDIEIGEAAGLDVDTPVALKAAGGAFPE